jgi:plasmid stabilization system protein ParE
MVKQVRWTLSAQPSLDEALRWLRARSLQAAASLLADVGAAADRLASIPGLGQRVRGFPEARSYLLRKWQKRILFRETEGAILVLAFRDQRRRNAIRAP